MVSDRSGVEIDENEFTSLINVRIENLRRIKVRNGAADWSGEVHAGSATGVIGLDRFVQENGTLQDFKVLDTGVLYKSTDDGNWASHKTGLANARHFFASLVTEKTGAAADVTDTADNANSTTVTANGLGAAVNAHVGKILLINNERKLIAWNTADTIGIAEAFDVVPAAGNSFTISASQKEAFFANGTDFEKTDGTTVTVLDTRVNAYPFDGITEHDHRIWGWTKNEVRYSDKSVGENFSRNAMFPYTEVQVCKPVGNVIAVWETDKVTAIEGDNPDNYKQIPGSPNRGTTSPFSVATWGTMQFGLNKDVGVLIVSTDELNPGGVEPLSASDEYISKEILAHTDAQLNAACAEVTKNKYYLYIGTDLYVLHLKESMKAPRDDAGNINWIWTKDDYPVDVDSNVLRLLGTKLAAGSKASGQVYELEKASQFTDDGTAITATIEKQAWRPREDESQVVFWSMKVRQAIAVAQINMAFFADPDGTTYGSAMQTVDLNTNTDSLYEVKFTGNPSDDKSKGNTMSYKITTTNSIEVPGIEELHLLYMPNPVG